MSEPEKKLVLGTNMFNFIASMVTKANTNDSSESAEPNEQIALITSEELVLSDAETTKLTRNFNSELIIDSSSEQETVLVSKVRYILEIDRRKKIP